MRWKLLVLVSLGSALVAFCVWEVVLDRIFGSVRPVQRHDWLLLGSTLVPMVFATFAGIFVYRHTALKRKSQATITVVLILFVFIGTYLIGSKFLPDSLGIPVPCDSPRCH
jgi:small-conductance mechanosensitive channel